MTWNRRVRLWPTVVLSVTSVLLFIGGSVAADGFAVGSGQLTRANVPIASPASSGTTHWPVSSGLTAADDCNSQDWPPLSSWWGNCGGGECAIPFFSDFYDLFGPGCVYSQSAAGSAQYNGVLASVAAQNMATALGNALNVTAAEVANLNATTQELLSYYEGRAEAIVPYFLNQTWNTTTLDNILIDSGVVGAMEGLELAYGIQQWYDWQVLTESWNNIWGPTGVLTGSSVAAVVVPSTYGGSGFAVTETGYGLNVSNPYILWNPPQTNGAGHSDIFFNMAPGGFVFQANSGTYPFNANDGNETVYDMTTGNSFHVPVITEDQLFNGTTITGLPNQTGPHAIGPFDLLEVKCTGVCAPGETDSLAFSNSYILANVTSSQNGHGTYELFEQGGNPYPVTIPSYQLVCIAVNGNVGPGATGTCSSSTVPVFGNATVLGSGPSAVVAAHSFIGYGNTAQNLTYNVGIMAHAFYLVLKAMTDNNKYPIPADCAIPYPSYAFPTAFQTADYLLSTANVEAVYLGYLNAVAILYGSSFTNADEFCNDPNLAISFSWAASWNLALNITASIYLAGYNGSAVYPNGTVDHNSLYGNPATWPVKSIAPTLLFPFEYQLDIPVGTTFPIPGNDPVAALPINYTGNLDYGVPILNATTGNETLPAWGVPSYFSLNGYGNFTFDNGTPSNVHGPTPPQQGDAIYVSSCVYNNVTENPCDIAVLYFDHFAIGVEHGITSPPPPPIPGGLGGLTDCGFGVLNQWYDSWAGYIGSAIGNGFGYAGNAVSGIPLIGGGLSYLIKGLGCIVAWIIVILILVLFAYIVYRIVLSVYHGARRSRSTGENVS